MTNKAIPVLNNKFWIVEDPTGEKIGTIQVVSDGTEDAVLVSNNKRLRYPSISVLGKQHNISFTDMPSEMRDTKQPSKIKEGNTAYGYPVDCDIAYNIIMNVKLGAPVYTKSKNSKSEYAAGYYLVNYNGTWVKEFCPRKLVLARNDFRGPWKTAEEQEQVLQEIKNEQ